MIALDIVTTGTPADETQLKNPANWSVSVAIGKAIQPIALKEVQWIPKVARVTLLILAS